MVEQGIDAVSLESHLSVILSKAVAATLFVIADQLGGVEKVSEQRIAAEFPELNLEILGRLVHRHFSSLDELQQEKAFRGTYNYFKGKALSLTDRVNWFHSLWNTVRVPLIDITNIIQAARGKDGIKPVEIAPQKSASKPTIDELINDLYAVSAVTEQLQFDGWYILIDKVDEDEHTDSGAEKATKLVTPLIKNLRILEIPRLGFKFFLWDQVRPLLVEEKVRLDKIRNWTMSWSRDELRQMINRRLAAYSNNRVLSLDAISSEDLSNIYDTIIDHAMFSPREIVHILDSIFREHARHSDADTGILLSASSVDKGLDDYCSRRVKDLYPSDIIRTLTSLPSTRFTSANIQAALRISKQAASVRVNKWIDNGYIERIEDARSEKDSSTPVHQYKFREKRLERLVERRIDMKF